MLARGSRVRFIPYHGTTCYRYLGTDTVHARTPPRVTCVHAPDGRGVTRRFRAIRYGVRATYTYAQRRRTQIDQWGVVWD